MKTRSFLRTFVAFFAIDTGVMIIATFPYFLNLLRPLQSGDSSLFPHLTKSLMESNVGYSVLLIGFVGIVYFLHDRTKFFSLMKNFRLGRIIHVLLLLGFGIFLGLRAHPGV